MLDAFLSGAAGRPAAEPVLAVAGRLVRYGLAGTAALAVHLAVLTALVELSGCDATVSSAVGFACAVPVNFWLQRNFVFRSDGACLVQFGRYAVITAATLVLNTAMFFVLREQAGLHYLAAQIVSTGVALAANFVLNQTVAFAPARFARVRP